MSAPATQRPPVAVRRPQPDEFEACVRVLETAFGETPSDAAREAERSVVEPGRQLAAYVGNEIVGVSGIFSLAMTVPGGPLPVAGVTWVAVLPSHRRRGVLSSMMRTQLHGLHDDGGEVVAALWASESGIYGRFGYGAATRHLNLRIPRGAAFGPAAPDDPELEVRILGGDEQLEELEAVRQSDRLVRPGMFVRNETWRRHSVYDAPGDRGGSSELRVAIVVDGSGTLRGYARYATEARWEDAGPRGVVHVREAHAADPAAYARLWRFLVDIDLTAEVRVRLRPLDDPLLELLADPRAAVPVVSPGLFVRLVDVDRALAARAYAAPVDVVLDVTDSFCPWNAGRWRLSADTSGATCTRTDAAADLTLSSVELGAAYLGGTLLHTLGAAGRVAEHRSGGLIAATRAFANTPLPWCPQIF